MKSLKSIAMCVNGGAAEHSSAKCVTKSIGGIVEHSGAASVKSVKSEKSEQGDCQKSCNLYSEFLLEVPRGEVLAGSVTERGFLLTTLNRVASDRNSDRTRK